MPVSFVHLTDLHVNSPDLPDPGLLTDTTATLRDVKAMIAALDPAPAFVVVSGDLTNTGHVDSFRTLRDLLADIGLPLFVGLGNHDKRPGFYEGYLGQAPSQAPYDHADVVAGVHVIMLDSSVPGSIGGNLGDDQLAWLAAELERHAEAPKLVVVHHPPDVSATPEPDAWHALARPASERLAELLHGRGVVGVLSGHVHYDSVVMANGIAYITGGGLHAGTDKIRTSALHMTRSASIGLGRIDGGQLSMTFVPLPGDRSVLRVVTHEQLRAYEAGLSRATAPEMA